jgi:calcium/calmodulin-dependent protein kinase I
MGCFASKEKKPAKKAADTKTAPAQASNNSAKPEEKKAAQPTKKKELNSDSNENIDEHYILGEELGTGGFSIVVEATSKRDGEKYAVKIIDKSMIKEDIKLLKREIDIMKKVDHKNILKLHEIYEDDQKVYIVMELINGSELFDRIVEKGFYSEKNAQVVVKQILEAVRYLHSKGIAHRDLKPENLLCSGTGEDEVVKIADFGLSKIQTDEERLQTSCGTPGYVAPEVLLCESYDQSVDMWGVGIITYILLAGYPPFYDENNPGDDTALFEKVINVEYDMDDECWDDVSDLAKDFIRHLLVKDPKERLTAEQALDHEWFKSKLRDKELRISRKMSEYNIKRKELVAAAKEGDDVAELNRARGDSSDS